MSTLDAAHAIARQPKVRLGAALVAVSIIALMVEARDGSAVTTVGVVAGGALPGGLALVVVGSLLAWGQRRDLERAEYCGSIAIVRSSRWVKTLRVVGALTVFALAWWVIGWLLVWWIGGAVDGWMNFGFWPSEAARP